MNTTEAAKSQYNQAYQQLTDLREAGLVGTPEYSEAQDIEEMAWNLYAIARDSA